jgi:hypothetical protein
MFTPLLRRATPHRRLFSRDSKPSRLVDNVATGFGIGFGIGISIIICVGVGKLC